MTKPGRPWLLQWTANIENEITKTFVAGDTWKAPGIYGRYREWQEGGEDKSERDGYRIELIQDAEGKGRFELSHAGCETQEGNVIDLYDTLSTAKMAAEEIEKAWAESEGLTPIDDIFQLDVTVSGLKVIAKVVHPRYHENIHHPGDSWETQIAYDNTGVTIMTTAVTPKDPVCAMRFATMDGLEWWIERLREFARLAPGRHREAVQEPDEIRRAGRTLLALHGDEPDSDWSATDKAEFEAAAKTLNP